MPGTWHRGKRPFWNAAENMLAGHLHTALSNFSVRYVVRILMTIPEIDADCLCVYRLIRDNTCSHPGRCLGAVP